MSFTYTNTGQRATMTDASGTTTYTYSNRDQVLTKATPQGTLTYTYDLAGNVASVNSSNTNGTSVTYAYDANNRLQSVTDARTSGVTSYTYDATNQLDTFTYANGVMHDYSYDNRDRMTGLSVTKSGVLASYTQTFSDSGRKLTAAENSGRTAMYGYDSIYRLLSEGITGDPVTGNNGSLTYTLDAVGNRSTLASTLAVLGSQSATYDNNDRISGDTFDSNGNTLTSGGSTYTYDFEDRLLTATGGITIVYDGDGNRASKTVSGVTTKYLVDDAISRYPQVLEELVNGTVIAQYTYGKTRISQNLAGVVSCYGYDAGLSVRQLFDGAGQTTDTFAYDAFGNIVTRTGSTINKYLYRGEQFDDGLGMYYLRARYYIPRTGRFLTQDKYEAETQCSGCSSCGCGCSQCGTTNRSMERLLPRYAYVGGDPVNRIDPSGFFEEALPTGLITVPTRAAVIAAVRKTAGTALVAGITVVAAYLLTEAIDCREKIRQCRDKCTATIVEEGGLFDASDIRNCVRLCLKILGADCDY